MKKSELVALGFEAHVLTKGPAAALNAWTEKMEGCQEHLPGIHYDGGNLAQVREALARIRERAEADT